TIVPVRMSSSSSPRPPGTAQAIGPLVHFTVRVAKHELHLQAVAAERARGQAHEHARGSAPTGGDAEWIFRCHELRAGRVLKPDLVARGFALRIFDLDANLVLHQGALQLEGRADAAQQGDLG